MPEIRRILVAMEPGIAQDALAESAMRLAKAISADVHALLIQDPALLLAAGLAFTQEILTPSGERRVLTRESLELDFEVLARRIETKLQHSARSAGLNWRLNFVSGDPLAQVIAAASDRDLIMLGFPRRAPLSVTDMREVAEKAGRPTLFMGDVSASRGGLLILDGGVEQPERAELVRLLVQAFPGQPTIFREAEGPRGVSLRHRIVLALPEPMTARSGHPELS